MNPTSVFAAAVLLGGLTLNAQDAGTSAGPKPYPERLRWWADARFGMFIHWGPVSLTGHEIG